MGMRKQPRTIRHANIECELRLQIRNRIQVDPELFLKCAFGEDRYLKAREEVKALELGQKEEIRGLAKTLRESQKGPSQYPAFTRMTEIILEPTTSTSNLLPGFSDTPVRGRFVKQGNVPLESVLCTRRPEIALIAEQRAGNIYDSPTSWTDMLAVVEMVDHEDVIMERKDPLIKLMNGYGGLDYIKESYPQLTLTRMATEVIGSLGCRQHVFGILIDGMKISLWYFDRVGIISTAEFRFFDNLDLFATAILFLSRSSLDDLGFDPAFDFTPRTSPPSNLEGAQFKLLRGTRLLNSKGFSSEIPPRTLFVVGSSCGPMNILTGMRVSAYTVNYQGYGDDELIAKLTWRHRNCSADLKGKGKAKADESWQPSSDIPSRSKSSLHLRLQYPIDDSIRLRLRECGRLTSSADAPDSRELLVELTSQYSALNSVPQPTDLFKVVGHSMSGHKRLLEEAGILHGDVAMHSVMYHKRLKIGLLIEHDKQDPSSRPLLSGIGALSTENVAELARQSLLKLREGKR
ncbi:hypothetical protein SISSUDRAFT_1132252 [Sistotremastrum suecicum HHB10207 ss-3]|uniref:Fungal-type protein kinase domain-containing protein n=1 Tax=Sistotremastrum suecicum HHB10207 ss-3 TaxID=1314776 RepID=A0A165Z3W4_9AGAM|nr:hypothetical protein SISSUDRAFT_1132252 [Sistotremastrum suecicum HHB10207 ss-3]